MRYQALSLILAVILTVGAVRVQPTAASNRFVFERADCPFETAPGDNVECGYVTVPENHADPTGAQIRLAVAVLRTSSPSPSRDAVIYLDGGPGGETLVNYGPSLGEYFGGFTAARDVVIFDQRGTGFSTPSLDCPELQTLTLEYLDDNLPDDKRNNLSNEAAFACRDRIVSEGVNLEHFNTIQNAADVDAIRQALGYDQFNLYGISYGTRLALTVMRDFPAGVRTAIIDSAVPLQADFNRDFADNTNRVFDLLFESCAADPNCDAAYPNLKEVALETARQLDENPQMMPTIYGSETLDDLLDGDYFFTILFQSLYATSLIPYLPEIIYQVSEGDYSLLGWIAGFFLDDTFSEGMNYTFNCNEEYPFTDMDAALASYNQFAPEYAPYISSDGYVVENDLLNFCELWGAGTAPASENEAVVSDIPTLLMAGEFDPVTPPRYTQWVGETLSNSLYVEFPGAGHGPSLDGGCPTNIALSFVEVGTTDILTSCVAQMPKVPFDVPLVSVPMMQMEMPEIGVSALVPATWGTDGLGYFERFAGEIPFMGYRVPSDGLEGYFDRIIRANYGYTELPAPMESVTAPSGTWTVYDIVGQNIYAYFAFTEINGQAYVIAVGGSSEEERAIMYEQAFLPAIQSFAVMS
ncbi:MAG: alpha/beta fold hydrolase [Anaerolineae bacterium]|nr:alpha/beta fold hydrolase [Anaerolineae bacterium]